MKEPYGTVRYFEKRLAEVRKDPVDTADKVKFYKQRLAEAKLRRKCSKFHIPPGI